MREAPVRPAMALDVFADTTLTGLERVVRPEAAGQHPQSQLQMRHIVGRHRLNSLIDKRCPHKRPVVGQQRMQGRQIGGRAVTLIGSAYKSVQAAWQVVLGTLLMVAKQHFTCLTCQWESPEAVQPTDQAEQGFVREPIQQLQVVEKVRHLLLLGDQI